MCNFLDFPSLCNIYKDYFKIGAALNYLAYTNKTIESEIAKKHFNIAVAENDTKMDNIYLGDNNFNFSDADVFLSFARQNQMEPRWHTILWHNQYPQWIFSDSDGNHASNKLIEKRIQNYVQTVFDHCKDQVISYDIVNAALSDKTGKLRDIDEKSPWISTLGIDYIEKLFNWAHEANPKAELVLNDYNIESDKIKREGFYQLVQNLLHKNIPLSAVGLQMHTSLYGASVKEIEDTINLFGKLGIKVLITEMDVSVYNYKEAEKKNFSTEILENQANRYKELFESFKRCSRKGFVEKVILWGITDEFSWRNNYPVPNRKDIPLLFKMDGSVKPAFNSLIL